MSGPEPAVEVAYAQPNRQRIVRVALRDGMTAGDAVAASGLTVEFPELAARPMLLGIYGRRVDAAQTLRDGDRVEIYRELRSDPREARRRAVQQARAGKGSGPGR